MSRKYRSRGSMIRGATKNRADKSSRSGCFRFAVIAVSVILLAGIGVGIVAFMNPDGKGAAFPTASGKPIGNMNELLDSNKFYDGIYVDGMPLGGLTRDEAKKQIESVHDNYINSTGVTVIDPNKNEIKLMISNLPKNAYRCDTDSILEKSWSMGRNQATKSEKLEYIRQLPHNPVRLVTTVTADPSPFELIVRDLAAPFETKPQNAKYNPEGFDPTKEGADRLSFIPEVPGQQVNPDTLWGAVKAEFINRTFNDVQMALEPVQPSVTQADLRADMQLVKISPITIGNDKENSKLNDENEGHTYTTQIFDHSKERLTNITLANKAVSGIVMPGEVFSMNAKTGNRTAAQGYQIAPIDRSGIVDKGLGGGVCQVSGTLYNAAIRYGGKYESEAKPTAPKDQPGLAITARDSHSLPSAYLHTGTDATVDIASKKDLQFRNDFDKPVLVVMYYEKNTKGEYFEHCDIFGPQLPGGSTYDLIRKNSKSIPADTTIPPRTVFSKYAKPGSPTYIKPRAGYSVDIYIEQNIGGEKTQTYAYSSSYKPQSACYYVFTGETAPTSTPLPTPTPTQPATPVPTASPAPTATQASASTPLGVVGAG